MRRRLGIALILIVSLLSGCSGPAKDQVGAAEGQPAPTREFSWALRSTAFADGEMIPVQYTCDGEDRSPALEWEQPPEGTVSLALIMDDPDAPVGVWTHWVLYNLPADVRGLEERVPADEILPNGGLQGLNSWKRIGYGGPCPPPGHGIHHYWFRLYALDTRLDLEAGSSVEEVRAAMEGHILAIAELVGTYQR